MFCPKCAAQNVEGASFCRVCGANISLIPQALTGNLPVAPESDDWRGRRRHRRGRDAEPSFERGIVNVFVGLGFIIAALAIMSRFPAGVFWGWALFIPGFSNLGRGVASIVAARRSQGQGSFSPGNAAAYFPNQRDNSDASQSLRSAGPSAPQTGELRTPVPSVTEGTTRHLAAEAPTRHFDESN